MRGYWHIALKEFMHLRRDRTTLIIALVIPIFQVTLFGFAIDFDVRHIKTVVADLDRSRESREYVARLVATQFLDVDHYAASGEEAQESLRKGETRVAIIIPPDFSRRFGNETAAVRVLVDGSDNEVATRARLAFATYGGVTGPNAVEARVNVLYNPDMRTQTFMIPGLIGLILQLVTVSLTAISIVREREQGTLEQLMVSPVGRLGLMLGKLTPYAVLAMGELATVLLIGRYLFDVHVHGSVLLLIILSIPFIIAALSGGLLISTIAQNQMQAIQMSLFITLPTMLLSGFVFPRETMPGVIWLASNALPVTFFLDIIRGIVVRGAGLTDLLSSVIGLVAIAAVLLVLSVTRFRKSIA